MTDGPNTHTFSALMQNWQNRLVAVERRLARTAPGLPDRLGTTGQEVGDWDDAVAPGFYHGDSAANGPTAAGSLTVGVVTASDTRVVQEVWSASVTDGVRVNTWRRVLSGTWTAWLPVGNGYYLGTIAHTLTPADFPIGLSYGISDASYPTNVGTVEVVRHSDARTVQRCWEKADQPYHRYWYRTSVDAATWGAWVLAGGDTGWLTLTPGGGWSQSNLGYKIKDGDVIFKGEFWGGADLSTVFTLPVGARPVSRLSFQVNRIVSSTTPQVGSVSIQTTGIATFVNVSGVVLTTSPGYSIGTVRFPVE